ncbi:MAG: hypothetical protein QXS20_00095 [Candidatus Thorarchaeota archaeon]
MVLARQLSGDRGSVRLVRGCPCYKVFGDEKLCVNDDNILEMNVIEIDPTLFAFHQDKESLELERADSDDICYCAIYINYPDNRVYCVSQGWPIRIHGKDVLATDLESAMQFLTTKDVAQNAEVCSECLYKFLLTLSDQFADSMSKKERTDEVKRYVNRFSLMMAVKLSQMDSTMKPIGTDSDVREDIDHFEFLRGYLVQLLERQSYWAEVAERMNLQGFPQWTIELVRKREMLARAEFQFYSQTLQLRDIEDFNLIIKMLSFILRTADEILKLNSQIHSEIRSERFMKMVEHAPALKPLLSYADKSRAIEHNFGNILQILSKL